MAKNTASSKRGASRTQPSNGKSLPGWLTLFFGLAAGAGAMYLLQFSQHGQNKAPNQVQELDKPAKPAPPAKSTGKAPKYEFYTLLPDSETVVSPESVEQPAPSTPAPETPKPAPQKPVTAEEAKKIDSARAAAALAGKVPPPPPQLAKKAPSEAKPAAAPSPAPTATPANVTYFLQAGSFRRQQDANTVRARLAILGLSVRVESGTVRDETWYRVLVGPYADRTKLTEAQKKLQSNGFSSLLIQQRKAG